MVKTLQGALELPTGRVAVVAARFNEYVVEALLVGALRGLKACGVTEDRIDVVRVPGSFELPLTAQCLAETRHYAAVICLGAIIRGDTDHYRYVCEAATRGILEAGLKTGIPVIFGVLTCDTEAQALDRAGVDETNKGYEAARVAVEMANLLNRLS